MLTTTNYLGIYNEFEAQNVNPDDILLLFKQNDNTLYGIRADDMFDGLNDSNQFNWVSTANYNSSDIVVYDEKWWQSLQNSNTGIIPSENTFWTQLSKITATNIEDWQPGVYPNYSVKTVNQTIYRLKSSVTLPFNSVIAPDLDPTNWEILGGSDIVIPGNLGEIQYSDGSGGLNTDGNLTWDAVNRNFVAAGNATTTGTDSVNFGLDSTTAARWAFNNCEQGNISSSANNSFCTGFANTVGDGSGGSGSISFTGGVDNINNVRAAFLGGIGGRFLANGRSGGIVMAMKNALGRKAAGTPFVTAVGTAINISRNTSSQVDGNGALAGDSGIILTVDGHIPADATGSITIGGDTIVVPAATTNTVFMPKLRIGQGTNATIANSSSTDESVFLDSNNEFTKSVTKYDFVFETAPEVAGVVNLDMQERALRRFVTTLSANASITLSNDSNKSDIALHINASNTIDVSFPAGTKSYTNDDTDITWASGTSTLNLIAGAGTLFVLDLKFNGTDLVIDNVKKMA